jgi:hypothetical protein
VRHWRAPIGIDEREGFEEEFRRFGGTVEFKIMKGGFRSGWLTS